MVLMGLSFGIIFPLGMVLGVGLSNQLAVIGQLGLTTIWNIHRSLDHDGTSLFKSSEPLLLSSHTFSVMRIKAASSRKMSTLRSRMP